jgi:hypothetical protein
LFEAALDIPEEGRAAFLREQSAGDTELGDILADLLEITATADTLLDGPGDALLRAALDGSEAGETEALGPGQGVGRYRVTGEMVDGGATGDDREAAV